MAKPVILIVDDDVMNLTMAQMILEMKVQAEYLTADSGQACINVLNQRQGKVDLILLDIAMPGMDGIQTLTRIRQHPEWKNIHVIFLTAAADKNTIVRAAQLKVKDYVKKPFTPDELISRVEKHITPDIDDPEIQNIFKQLDSLGL
ncbi:MAG: response regulator [Selenomonas sp.]|nr:response regulator [Selenomonas sp.]